MHRESRCRFYQGDGLMVVGFILGHAGVSRKLSLHYHFVSKFGIFTTINSLLSCSHVASPLMVVEYYKTPDMVDAN